MTRKAASPKLAGRWPFDEELSDETFATIRRLHADGPRT